MTVMMTAMLVKTVVPVEELPDLLYASAAAADAFADADDIDFEAEVAAEEPVTLAALDADDKERDATEDAEDADLDRELE